MPYPGSPPGDVDTYIKPSLVPCCFASGLPAKQAAVIAATQRALAASTLFEPSGTPAWKTIPSWAVIGTADKVIPPALLQFMAQRAKARITDVDAGHLSLISAPDAVTQVIVAAARATCWAATVTSQPVPRETRSTGRGTGWRRRLLSRGNCRISGRAEPGNLDLPSHGSWWIVRTVADLFAR